MTDVGIYAAQEAEIMAALAGITDVVELKATVSVEDLIARDGIRTPAIGVIEAGAEWKEQIGIGQKLQRATFRWEVSVLVTNQRGRIDARSTLRTLMETVRDRLHYAASTVAPKARYYWRSDRFVEVARPDLLACVISFEVDALIGN